MPITKFEVGSSKTDPVEIKEISYRNQKIIVTSKREIKYSKWKQSGRKGRKQM